MKGKSKVFIGIFAILTLIAMVAVIVVTAIGKFSGKIANDASSLTSEDYLATVTAMHYSGHSYAEPYTGDIAIVSGDESFYNGFCANHGAALGVGYTLYDWGSCYGRDEHLNVLYDNIILPFGNDGPANNEDQYDFYFTKMEKLIRRYQASNANFGNMNARAHIYSTYEDEQYAIWNYTANNTAPTNNPNRALYRALISEANYLVSTKNDAAWKQKLVGLGGNTYVSITNNAKIQISGTTWKIGPFKLNNSAREFYKLGMDSITFTANGSNKTITNFNIVDSNGKAFVDSKGYSDYYGTEGDFYITFTNEFKKNVRYNVKLNGLKATTWETWTRYFGNGSNQPVATFWRMRKYHECEFNKGYHEDEGEYTLNIVKKSATDSSKLSDRSKALADATFEVKQWKEGADATKTETAKNSAVKSVAGKSAPITFNNNAKVTVTKQASDYYTVKESATPAGYNKTDWIIGLTVNKTSDLKIDSVKVSYGNKSRTVKAGNSILVKAGSESESSLSAYDVGVEVTNTNITLTWRNPKKDGKYYLFVKKQDEDTQKGLQGAVFTVDKLTINKKTGKTSANTKELTTNSQGVAAYSNSGIDITQDNVSEDDHYKIREIKFKADSENNGKYTKIVDPIEFYVAKDKDTYKVKGLKTSSNGTIQTSITKQLKDENGKSVKAEIKFIDGASNQILVIVDDKQKAQPFDFTIQKVDANNSSNFLKNTNMTIKRRLIDGAEPVANTETVLLNGTFNNDNASFKDTVTEVDQSENRRYQYEIHENDAQNGYKNIFKRVINGELKEVAYLKVDVWAYEVEKVTAKYEVVKTSNGTDDDVTRIKGYISTIAVDNKTRSVSLKVKNPKEEKNITLDLFKHELEDGVSHVESAEYSVKRIDANGTEIQDTNNTIVNSSFLTTDTNTDLVSIKTEYGKEYYYEVEETRVPNNYTSEIKAVRLKLETTSTGTVQGNIISVKRRDTNAWVNYTNDLANQVSLTAPDASNHFTLKMANSTYYILELVKKNASTNSTVTGGNFIVEKINRGANQEITTEQVYEGPFTKELRFNGAAANKTYEFYIQEETPLTAAETGDKALKNDFENVKIHIQVKMDSTGAVVRNRYYTKVVDFVGINGRNLTNEEKTVMFSKVNLAFSGNRVFVNITDEPEDDDTPEEYKLQILKIDKETRQPVKDAEFSVSTDANGAAGFMSYDADPDTDGTQNPKTDANGIAWIKNLSLGTGQHINHFRITEVRVGDDYQVLSGAEVDVEVDLNGVTTASDITADKVTTQFIGEHAPNYIERGVEVKTIVKGDGIIQIIIPNLPNEFDFVIKKVNTDGELIVASGRDGAEFEALSSEESSETILPRQVLEDGTVTTTVKCKKNSQFTYSIYERSTKSGYVNILDGYHIVLHGKVNANGEVIDINNDDPDNNSYYEIVQDAQNPATPIDEVRNAVNVGVEWIRENEEAWSARRTVIVTVENPYGYKLRLRKEGTRQEDISDKVTLEATLGNKTYTMNKTNGFVTDVTKIAKNETQVWTLKEISVESPYYNILGSNKCIKVSTSWDNTTNKIKVNEFGIYENDQLIESTNSIYNFVEVGMPVKAGGYYTIPVTIKNPTKFRFKLGKYEADGVTLMEGATITIGGDTVIPNNESASEYSELSYLAVGQTRSYIIYERSTKANHRNILEGNRFVIVVIRMMEDNKPAIVSTLYYEINPETHAPVSFDNEGLIKGQGGVDADGIPYIGFKILNPVDFEFEVSKVDTSREETKIPGVTFTVHSPIINAQEGEYKTENIGDGVSYVSVEGDVTGVTTEDGIMNFNEKNIELNREYEYEVIERYTPSEAYSNNVFSSEGYHIFVKVNVDADGNITLGQYPSGRNVEIRNADGEKAEDKGDEKYYDYVSANVDTSTGKAIVDVKVKNPVQFKVKINKKIYSEDNVDLSGRSFTLYSGVTGKATTLTTDENGNITIAEDPVEAGTYNYVIKENDPTGNDLVNPLSGYFVAFTINVAGDGTLTVVKETEGARGVTIYKGETVETATKVESNDKVYGYISSPIVTNSNGVPEVGINIYNPQKYYLKVLKKDLDTGKAMNGVVFNATAYNVVNDSSTETPLKNAMTLENIDLNGLETKNVDGEDGIIEIENVQFEHTGKYRIKFTEVPVDGYKKIGDIDLIYNVVINAGRFDIENVELYSEDGYVIAENVELTNVDNKLMLKVNVDNERIKGSYDLTINKIDKNTLSKLDGAEVSITAIRDGVETALYESNNDVESKNVVVPIEKAVIKNGKLEIKNIRIEKEETYNIRITETKTPDKYVDLANAIYIKVKTKKNEDGTKYILDEASLISEDEDKLVNVENNEEKINVTIKNQQFDLALRKYITKVVSREGQKDEDVRVTTGREPVVDTTDLLNNTKTTATYNHAKDPISVYANDYVYYTIRIYNEADVAGYAEVITDHLPEYLEFVDDKFNQSYGWTLDSSDNTGRTVTTNYLSKAKNAKANLIKAFDRATGKLDYKEIQIKCKVKENAPVQLKLTNIAEITKFVDSNGKDVVDRDSEGGNVDLPKDKDLPNYKDKEIADKMKYIPGQQDDDDFEKVLINEFDLALRKFITGVTNCNGEKTEVKTRIPKFKVDKDGNYVYDHTKEPVLVANQNVVEYTIRVYNEGTVNGYASVIKDDIPNGLVFLPDDALNVEYRWVMLDENGKETEDSSKAKFITTDYLSKEQEKTAGENLLKAFDKSAYDAGSINEPDYKEVKVAFKVTMPNTSDKIIINKAQISDDTDENGNAVDDKDSVTDVWNEGEDDQDIEKIKVQWFDLSLRKWVTKAIVIENGKQTVTETGHKAEDNPEETVKVDLKKSKIDDVVVKFEYQIRVKNESPIPGSVEEITDYIPEGLKFVKEDNPDWKEVSEGVVTTDKLSGKILKKDETAEVTIVLTWINREDNMGLKINVAEISKDYNEFGSPDIDSVPNNKVPGEDDIDDAPVMLTVKTGEELVYAGLALAVLTILAGGAYTVKKYVLK